MKTQRKTRLVLLAACSAFAITPLGYATGIDAELLAMYGLEYVIQGVQLPNDSTSDWFYGCSPTSAGMAMGYYDRNGYDGKIYDNLVAGGEAPPQNIAPNPSILKSTIASVDHWNDYYSGASYPGTYWNGNNASYGTTGDDVGTHDPNCLADFMGTSQDAIGFGNPNGATLFYFYANGTKLHYYDLSAAGFQDDDGMYGIYEYVKYAGYDVTDAYTQLTENQEPYGFTFDEYRAEIDGGRPVLVHLYGHTMLGVGYDFFGSNPYILFHNTWDQNTYSMPWGGTYYNMELYGVTVFELTGGQEPGPGVPDGGATLLFMAMGMFGLKALQRRAA